MIPNEDELCRGFGVSRITVRRAVSDLEAQGLLEKRQGRGTFVAAQVPSARESATLSFIDTLKESLAGTRKTLVSMTTETPPPDIARQLDLVEGSKATKSVRLHSATLPVLLVEAWVHEEIGRNISEDDLRKTALHELLVSQGILFGRAVQEITAVAATPVTTKLLLTEFGTPLVKMTRLLYHVPTSRTAYDRLFLTRAQPAPDGGRDRLRQYARGGRDLSRHAAGRNRVRIAIHPELPCHNSSHISGRNAAAIS